MEPTKRMHPLPPMSAFYLNNCKAHSILFSGQHLTQENEFHISVLPKKRIEIVMAVQVDTAQNPEGVTLGPYESAVLDAIYTLSVYHCPHISLEMLIRVMYGSLDMDVTEKQKAAMATCLEHLAGVNIRIDCSAELIQRKKISKGDYVILDGPLLPLQQCDDGNTYMICGTSPIYEYAETIRQIISIPAEIMQAGNLRNEQETMLLRRYLLKRTATMKNGHNHMVSARIALSRWDRKTGTEKGLIPSLYGSTAIPRKKKSKVCRTICAILSGLQEAGYIAGFAELRQGRSIHGYDINL